VSDFFNPVGNLTDQDAAAVILKGRYSIRIEGPGGASIELRLTGARKLRDWLNKAVPDERDAGNGEPSQ
jgi:hypothetical protein